MEALQSDSGVPPNYIIGTLPPDLLKMIFRVLPSSNRFVSPVCRHFHSLYGVAVRDKTKTKNTYQYSITTEAAFNLYLEETSRLCLEETKYCTTSVIGAGCGRTDWVERGGVFDVDTCRSAAAGGQLHVLKWLRECDCPWDSLTCMGAAMNGHLEVLKWARGNGCPWNWRTCYGAAYSGHLEVLIWARGHGCPWNEGICWGAAQGGHLKVLKWAIENGCPYRKSYFDDISDSKFLEWFVEW
eukprot:CAMPEP_0194349842 /NCGR_PEP_ID=MMETSP0171-20130528/107317_1 /TAXON_ID=218684 /ORGANISM="Corethron pennatum, Strain L29A3" /LENGTH=240 /DNA_ID=CAMNT_0039117341 /DNA_START=90 /DNA_END=809 /DNA_ORIENTATION=+